MPIHSQLWVRRRLGRVELVPRRPTSRFLETYPVLSHRRPAEYSSSLYVTFSLEPSLGLLSSVRADATAYNHQKMQEGAQTLEFSSFLLVLSSRPRMQLHTGEPPDPILVLSLHSAPGPTQLHPEPASCMPLLSARPYTCPPSAQSCILKQGSQPADGPSTRIYGPLSSSWPEITSLQTTFSYQEKG